MSDGNFVTNEGYDYLKRDIEASELSLTDYWKLIFMKRDGDSMVAVRHTIQAIDAWIMGRTTTLMRQWQRHRERYTELQYALVEFRPIT